MYRLHSSLLYIDGRGEVALELSTKKPSYHQQCRPYVFPSHMALFVSRLWMVKSTSTPGRPNAPALAGYPYHDLPSFAPYSCSTPIASKCSIRRPGPGLGRQVERNIMLNQHLENVYFQEGVQAVLVSSSSQHAFDLILAILLGHLQVMQSLA